MASDWDDRWTGVDKKPREVYNGYQEHRDMQDDLFNMAREYGNPFLRSVAETLRELIDYRKEQEERAIDDWK